MRKTVYKQSPSKPLLLSNTCSHPRRTRRHQAILCSLRQSGTISILRPVPQPDADRPNRQVQRITNRPTDNQTRRTGFETKGESDAISGQGSPAECCPALRAGLDRARAGTPASRSSDPCHMVPSNLGTYYPVAVKRGCLRIVLDPTMRHHRRRLVLRGCRHKGDRSYCRVGMRWRAAGEF